MTERLWEEYESFATRDLSEYEVAYLFVDGVAERLRPGERREAVLVAWSILVDGRKVLLHLMPGSREDTESCRAMFQDMKALAPDAPAGPRLRLVAGTSLTMWVAVLVCGRLLTFFRPPFFH